MFPPEPTSGPPSDADEIECIEQRTREVVGYELVTLNGCAKNTILHDGTQELAVEPALKLLGDAAAVRWRFAG